MNRDRFTSTISDDVLTLAVRGTGDSYMIWQVGLTPETGSEDGIYFEFNDQINGGYNHISQCFVYPEGLSVVQTDGTPCQLIFPSKLEQIDTLKTELAKIYKGAEHVLNYDT